jgi:hypothetical protein
MIRHRRGNDFFLIAQHDHALLAGQFAEQIGNHRFDGPTPRQPVLDGIALHDAGWPLHDDRPTLNPRGEPLHVLEVSMPIATRVWNESVRIAAERHPYAGLLVSLHVLNLSMLAQRHDFRPHERARNDPADLFELNKFQHRQIEWQEQLRKQLGLRTDLPLKLGLADAGAGADEDLLRFNFGLLRLMDSLSLDACASEDLFPEVRGIHPRPGEAPVMINIGHPAPLSLTVDPWPFGADRIVLPISARRVSTGRFASSDELQQAYGAAPVDTLEVRLGPRV